MDSTNYVSTPDLDVPPQSPILTTASYGCGCKCQEDTPEKTPGAYITIELEMPAAEGKEEYDFLPFFLKFRELISTYPITVQTFNSRKSRW